MPIKSVKIKISKNKKMRFFLMFQGSLDQKIRFLGQKVSSVALQQTHRHESEYRGYPFRVSGIFPSTYHQGAVQLPTVEAFSRKSVDLQYVGRWWRHICLVIVLTIIGTNLCKSIFFISHWRRTFILYTYRNRWRCTYCYDSGSYS